MVMKRIKKLTAIVKKEDSECSDNWENKLHFANLFKFNRDTNAETPLTSDEGNKNNKWTIIDGQIERS